MATRKGSWNDRVMQGILNGTNKPEKKKKEELRGPSESQIQQDVIGWFWKQYPRLAEAGMLFHIPNEGIRLGGTGARMVREGIVRGVADLCLAMPRKGFGVLWIEMKKKGGRVRPEQKTWGSNQMAVGNKYVVCYSFEEAVREIKSYLE